eukprot:GHRR01031337.1.p1 GENE.GHRR01031337.1~~GHRR01031337.1.p1  ORF type:complete len:194 (+),score=73.04 GHRR01031337.1:595-1176(+)
MHVDLDREIIALKREEEKLIRDIKAAAKTNNQAAMKILAKSLIRLRGQITKLHGSAANLKGVSTNLTTAAAATTVSHSMATATTAMGQLQKQMNPAKVNQTMQQFQKENARMEMTQEMMGDTLDSAMDDETTEEETGDLVNQVLDEIGVDLSAALGAAPKRKAATSQAVAHSSAADEGELGEDLAARLATLRS